MTEMKKDLTLPAEKVAAGAEIIRSFSKRKKVFRIVGTNQYYLKETLWHFVLRRFFYFADVEITANIPSGFALQPFLLKEELKLHDYFELPLVFAVLQRSKFACNGRYNLYK
ncbi:hypothetical protein [Endomicrobium proavitum]|uniref:hypothetical protein n=1 Tax=Endomicrobium proavitum TaxID=1408281 RepID=UPI00130EA606|nr:hypothetical protein [Endomicrobium proavitum]